MSLHTLCWMPTFHSLTRGGLKSKAVGLIPSVGLGSPPDASDPATVPRWSVEFSTPGALEIMSNTMFPCGRS